MKWWGDEPPPPGQHIVFSDVLNPYLVAALTVSGQEDFLEKTFRFLEELANHEDDHVKELVGVTVCEELVGHKAALAKARDYGR